MLTEANGGYKKFGFLLCLVCCFTSMVNSWGHVGAVSYVTTLLLGKSFGGSLLVISAHSFASN